MEKLSFKDMMNEEDLEEQRLDEAFIKASQMVANYLRKNQKPTTASINKLALSKNKKFAEFLQKVAKEIQTDEKGAVKFVQDAAKLRQGISKVKA